MWLEERKGPWQLLRLGGESGYSRFASKSEWKYISYRNIFAFIQCQIRVDILNTDFDYLQLKEVEADYIIGKFFNLKYEIKHDKLNHHIY